jgi:hypothetical protein
VSPKKSIKPPDQIPRQPDIRQTGLAPLDNSTEQTDATPSGDGLTGLPAFDMGRIGKIWKIRLNGFRICGRGGIVIFDADFSPPTR